MSPTSRAYLSDLAFAGVCLTAVDRELSSDRPSRLWVMLSAAALIWIAYRLARRFLAGRLQDT